MPDRLPEELQQKLSSRLRYYEDLGIRQFFRHRVGPLDLLPEFDQSVAPAALADAIQDAPSVKAKTPPAVAPLNASVNASLPVIIADTLEAVRRDIGENCTRCKLHAGRTKLVFGDGSPTAKLLFIGEGPGRDEDLQGLPFIGRAGKLLTQMIEAMGLQRGDVYICNVVKCRPPQNRAPEADEVEACSPFLLRQIDLVNPASDRMPGLHRRPHDPQYHHGNFQFPRPMARISWQKIDGHLPSRLFAAKSRS